MSIIAIGSRVYRHEKHAVTTPTVNERKLAKDIQGGARGFHPRWNGWRFNRRVNLRGQEKSKGLKPRETRQYRPFSEYMSEYYHENKRCRENRKARHCNILRPKNPLLPLFASWESCRIPRPIFFRLCEIFSISLGNAIRKLYRKQLE